MAALPLFLALGIALLTTGVWWAQVVGACMIAGLAIGAAGRGR